MTKGNKIDKKKLKIDGLTDRPTKGWMNGQSRVYSPMHAKLEIFGTGLFLLKY